MSRPPQTNPFSVFFLKTIEKRFENISGYLSMATADEARRLRVEKGAVNHETYRSIFDKIVQRIELRARRGGTDIEYRIPPIVPGRPIFDVTHAVRYCRDKLVHRGFSVDVIDDVILAINWKQDARTARTAKTVAAKYARPLPPPSPKPSPKTTASMPKTTADIGKRLELLARKLNWT